MTPRWYVGRNNKKSGPFTSEQMRAMARAGRLNPGDMLLLDGASKWQQAKSIEWLFPSPPVCTVATVGDPPIPPAEVADLVYPLFRDPVKLAFATSGAFSAALILSLLAAIMVRWNPSSIVIWVLLTAFVAATYLFGRFSMELFSAKHRAIVGKPVRLFFGLGQFIVWEQNEGLLLLRDKRVADVIHGPQRGGGLRIIYPLLGEELRVRVPLTIQLSWFDDQRVSTREAVQLKVKVAIWWQVRDLEAYFYKIDREFHVHNDNSAGWASVVTTAAPTQRGQLAMAEIWIRSLAEASLRKLISDTSTFLIVSKRVSAQLPSELSLSTSEPGISGESLAPATPDAIADQLFVELQPRLHDYGLKVDRVEIQEVQLPDGIQQAVDEVWIASTLPKRAGHEAEALRQRLQTVVQLLGQNNAAMIELSKALPSGAFDPLATLHRLVELADQPARRAIPVASPTEAPSPATPAARNSSAQ